MHYGCMHPNKNSFFGYLYLRGRRSCIWYIQRQGSFLYSIFDVYACLCKVGGKIISFPADFFVSLLTSKEMTSA